ncbi:MAG TPA: FAD-dependent monooxygenase [Candidatus Binatia bacterium]|nr:FAD-dependent monooxygenase [Candidatus Binatia bacterium]
MERRDVIIVGSGPAGAATALALATRDPARAARTVLLEKARHPRDKTCAGGVIPKATALLDALGVRLAVPEARVDAAAVAVPGATVRIAGANLCRVVRRRDLDAALAWAARDRGVELREEERVVHVAREGRGVRVETARRTYWAPVVVGADGSGSVVRRALVGAPRGAVARAVMADVPIAATRWDGHAARRYDFDFTSCPGGLRGYRWTFPCLVGGTPHANVGVYALPPVAGARLQAELARELERIGACAAGWKAFPIQTFGARTRVAAPHVLLAGDAAGVDPLMGEGISFAIEYGLCAADAVVDAFARDAWDFTGYVRAVHGGAIGRKLRRLGLGARLFYGRHARAWLRLAAASRRAQAIGLAWYNGVDGWDERGALGALASLAGIGRPLPAVRAEVA